MTDAVETQVASKPFWRSKIVWLALATIFLGAIDQLNVLGSLLPVQYQGLFTLVLGVMTLAARTLATSTNVTAK